MDLRTLGARALAALGAASWLTAAVLLFTASSREGMAGLANVAGALLLSALASVPFALALFLDPKAPRGFVATAGVGCLLSLAPGIMLLRVGSPGAIVFGVASVAGSVAGLARAWSLWRG